MASAPVNSEVALALGRFFTGGDGPRHSDLTACFSRRGFGAVAPYPNGDQSLTKEQRVSAVIHEACGRPAEEGRALVDDLLGVMRAWGTFDSSSESFAGVALVGGLTQALNRAGWTLTPEGELRTRGDVDLTTGGRAALDEQLGRLQRASDDPGMAIGTAKDLLEAVAKFVVEELGGTLSGKEDYNTLWYLARDRLGIHPKDVAGDSPGGSSIRKILQSAWGIAEEVNELRKLQGTGHGRTLPTGVSADMAWLVVREACSVAEFALTTLDRQLGRAA